MSLIYQPIDDEDLWPNENFQVLHLTVPPTIGDRLPLGGPRAWNVVAVDEYRVVEYVYVSSVLETHVETLQIA